MQLTPSVRTSYANNWAAMKVTPSLIPQLQALTKRFAAYRTRYEQVQQATGVPWYFIAIVHERESDTDFDTYLGNGDPLNRKTKHVPAGRGPFKTWEDGAIDALRYQGLDKWKDWSLEGTLYQFEAYNGWGYVGKTNSPYVWSWTNLYSHGKYVEDGKYSSSAVDHQPGCAAMLWQMIESGLVENPNAAAPIPVPDAPVAKPDNGWLSRVLFGRFASIFN